MEHGACCIEDHRGGSINESGGPMPWATVAGQYGQYWQWTNSIQYVFDFLALRIPGLWFKVHGTQPRLHVYMVWSRVCCDSWIRWSGAVILNIRDFTSPTPTADGIFAESGHSGCFTYSYDHVPDCPHFLYGRSPVQCTSQVTLELGVDLNSRVSA